MLSAPPHQPLRRKVAAREESARFGLGGEDSRPCHASPALQFSMLEPYHSQHQAPLAQLPRQSLPAPPSGSRTHAPRRGAFYDASVAALGGRRGAERAPGERRYRGSRGRAGERRRHVSRPQPRRGRLSLRRRTRGAARAARPGLRAIPAHRPGATAVPQREPRGQRPRRLQAVGGADRSLQGGRPGRARSRRASQGRQTGKLRPRGARWALCLHSKAARECEGGEQRGLLLLPLTIGPNGSPMASPGLLSRSVFLTWNPDSFESHLKVPQKDTHKHWSLGSQPGKPPLEPL